MRRQDADVLQRNVLLPMQGVNQLKFGNHNAYKKVKLVLFNDYSKAHLFSYYWLWDIKHVHSDIFL